MLTAKCNAQSPIRRNTEANSIARTAKRIVQSPNEAKRVANCYAKEANTVCLHLRTRLQSDINCPNPFCPKAGFGRDDQGIGFIGFSDFPGNRLPEYVGSCRLSAVSYSGSKLLRVHRRWTRD